MDALIRSPRLASQRFKLGAASTAPSADVKAAAMAPSMPSSLKDDAQAQRRLLEARIRADLTAEVDRTLEAEREAARQRGFSEGEREGCAAAAAAAELEHAERHVALQTALEALRKGHDAARHALENRAADIAFVALTQIAGERAASREFVLGHVQATVRHADALQPLTLRLHPRDAAVLREALGTSARLGTSAVDVIDDETLDCGGCVVESPLGSLDATLPTQLRKLRELLDAAAGPEST